MRRRWIALLSAAVLFFFSTAAARAEIAPTAAVPEQQQWTASASATAAAASSSQLSSSSSSTSSRPRPSLALATTPKSHRRLLRCDSHSMVSASAKVLSDPKGNRGRADLFRSLNSTAFSVSTEGAINDRCSQADPIIDASSTEPLENRLVIHERPWTEKEIINTALRRRGVRVAAGVLTEYDLAAASPLLLPSLIRFRPLSDVLLGNEVSRVMDVFSDGEIPANSTINGLPRSVERLETVVASASGALMRRTISPRGLREMLSRPELVLLAMAAANRTLAPGTDNAAKNLRITKDEYRAFLMRDADVEICRDRRVLVGDVFAPVDRLFAAADTDNDGRLDASEIRRSNLTDAATVWILAGDTDGDGMLSAQELANGLPQFRDLQPRSGMQRALPEHLRRIRETAGLAAVASYDVDKDGRLALEEMRVHSSDFTRRSMGQTMVPVWYEDFLGFFFFGFSSSFFSSFRSCPRPLVFFLPWSSLRAASSSSTSYFGRKPAHHLSRVLSSRQQGQQQKQKNSLSHKQGLVVARRAHLRPHHQEGGRDPQAGAEGLEADGLGGRQGLQGRVRAARAEGAAAGEQQQGARRGLPIPVCPARRRRLGLVKLHFLCLRSTHR